LPGAVDDQRGLRVRYALWQREVARVARQLHAERPFDVAHHLTLGADWQPAGLGGIDGAAFVWGPVGGYSRPAWRLARWLGPRWVLDELVRRASTGLVRAAVGRELARRATIAVAQNRDVATRLGRYGARDVRVEPNVAIDPGLLSTVAAPAGPRDAGRRALYVGRLLRWKGVRVALDALARPELRGWTLDVFGDGPDRDALVRRAEQLGLGPLVTFHGARARPEVLAAVGRADVLVLPSVNDSAGWVAAEAVALGCPVVCLERGGPPEIAAAGGGRAVAVHGDVPGALALAWAAARGPGTPSGRWSSARLADLVDGWYRDAVARHAGTDPAGARA
jgi:glycosyltransferase involved in cell wall biosynthesis